ncbi:uncharacterized protein LOC134475005 [Cavia porcellus]|uniref:uncharacterized protein LOC134475005 n=1 Tax=Cavia porcellus TaxID=10141 RepID=UPI002FE2313C
MEAGKLRARSPLTTYGMTSERENVPRPGGSSRAPRCSPTHIWSRGWARGRASGSSSGNVCKAPAPPFPRGHPRPSHMAGRLSLLGRRSMPPAPTWGGESSGTTRLQNPVSRETKFSGTLSRTRGGGARGRDAGGGRGRIWRRCATGRKGTFIATSPGAVFSASHGKSLELLRRGNSTCPPPHFSRCKSKEIAAGCAVVAASAKPIARAPPSAASRALQRLRMGVGEARPGAAALRGAAVRTQCSGAAAHPALAGGGGAREATSVPDPRPCQGRHVPGRLCWEHEAGHRKGPAGSGAEARTGRPPSSLRRCVVGGWVGGWRGAKSKL